MGSFDSGTMGEHVVLSVLDPLIAPGIFEVSDEDRLHSFIDSYTLGIDLIRGTNYF